VLTDFTPGRTLRPARAGDGSGVVEILRRCLLPTPDHPNHPSYAGAVVLAAVDGEITVHEAVGDALRYTAGPVELSEGERVAMRPDSIFDLASITKVLTALLTLHDIESGRIDPLAPVAEYLPEFGRPAVTVGTLLTHTSGLPDVIDLDRVDASARRAAIPATPLVDGVAPGSLFRYSDVGLLVLGLLLERVTGTPLDALLRTRLTGPLGLADTGFNPAGDLADRMVATEAKPVRGLLRGVVHDENAAALGGVAGHAGVFSTAADLAVVAQMLINGGEYGDTRIFAEATVRRMLVDANAGLPAVDPDHRPGRAAHGLGVELDQSWYMGRLASPYTFGHTGFTGTSLVVDVPRRVVLVLLTNRVHPDRNWGATNPTRVAVADAVADTLAAPDAGAAGPIV
jgi:CubicO group peptidase (beta-lactamase class C family)